MGNRQRSENNRMEIPIDVIPNILLRLPTKDFVRSSCVCKMWRGIVENPSFRKLHVAHHAAAASSKPEVLLITETGQAGRSDEASVFNLSSGKALCQVAIPSGYRLAGVCNDFLCFALDLDEAPAIVCNPVTGETLQLPKAPPIPAAAWDRMSHLFVLGFSTPTKEYKMFRLSHKSSDKTNYIAVYTLGGGGGWRQRSYVSRFHPVQSPAPVHIDGNIFVAAVDLADKRAKAARMLVLDVATETPRSYPIPYNYNAYHEAWDEMLADGFDMNGEMCLVVNVGFLPHHSRHKTQFWVMKLPGYEGEFDGKDDDNKMYWDLRYSFFLDGPFYLNVPRGAWIDHTQTLCYRLRNSVYKYDTRGHSPSSNGVVDTLTFDKQVDLADSPSSRPWCPTCSQRLEFCRWSICGGYRPSLLSPLVFTLQASQDKRGKKRPQFENTLTHALMSDGDGP